MGSRCRYDLVVFDWDGTLMDSTDLIAECIGLAATDLGFPVPTVEVAKEVIGLGLSMSTHRLFPGMSDSARMQFVARYRHHYVPRDHEARLYAGIPTLLSGLSLPERFLAVATGKPRAGLERSFTYSGIKSHFHFSRCADEGFAKPHPDMLLYLMDVAAVSPERTLMIGDTTHDLELALNAGVDAVAVAYGAHSHSRLVSKPARAVVDSVEELSLWLALNG